MRTPTRACSRPEAEASILRGVVAGFCLHNLGPAFHFSTII